MNSKLSRVLSVLRNIGICLDQALNCCFRIDGEWGTVDEMLSARAHRIKDVHPQYAKWIDRVFFWDANHCEECYQIELNREQFPNHYRS